MSITMPPGVQLPQEHPLASLARGLGGGVETGMKAGLQQKMDMALQKQKQEDAITQLLKKAEIGQQQQQQQQMQNMQSATSLSDQLNLQGDARSQFINTLSSINAKDQPTALKNILESQILSQYGQQSGQPPPQGQPPKPPIEIAGFNFEEGEIPHGDPNIPGVGPLARAASIQSKERLANRAEINKWAEPYSDVTKLAKLYNDTQETARIVAEGKYKPGWIRSITTAFAEDKESSFAKLFKTADQQKLYSKIKDFIKPKELGGSNPSTREFLMALEAMPSYLGSQEANEYIANAMLNAAERNLTQGRLIKGIRRASPNIKYEDLTDIVENKMNQFDSASAEDMQMQTIKASISRNPPMPGYTWILTPPKDGKIGEPKQVPTNDINRYLQAGGELIQ